MGTSHSWRHLNLVISLRPYLLISSHWIKPSIYEIWRGDTSIQAITLCVEKTRICFLNLKKIRVKRISNVLSLDVWKYLIQLYTISIYWCILNTVSCKRVTLIQYPFYYSVLFGNPLLFQEFSKSGHKSNDNFYNDCYNNEIVKINHTNDPCGLFLSSPLMQYYLLVNACGK